MTRNEFLKLAGGTAAAMAVASIMPGCSSIQRNQPAMDSRRGMFITKAALIDIAKGAVRENQTLFIRDGRIAEIKTGSVGDTSGYPVIDAKGMYLMPGLIDAHCHMTGPSAGDFDMLKMSEMMNQMERNHVQQIISGTTTVRDMGSFRKAFHKNLDAAESGKLASPRVNFCNQMFNIAGSHPSFGFTDITWLGTLITAVLGDGAARFTGTPDMKKKLGEIYDSWGRGRIINFLKLTMDDRSLVCGKERLPVYDKDQLSLLRRFADEKKLPIACHVQFKFGFDRALEVGASSIEHMVCDQVLSDADVIRLKKAGTAVVPTMDLGQLYAFDEIYKELPREYDLEVVHRELQARKDYIYTYHERFCEKAIYDINMKAIRNYAECECKNMLTVKKKFLANPVFYFMYLVNGTRNLALMKEAGVLIGAGTDSGVPFVYHGTLWNEIELLHRLGFTKLEALQCATVNNAKILRMEDVIGSIDKGKYADIIVLESNPLEKLTTLREPRLVIKGGMVEYSRSPMIRENNVYRVS